MKYFINKIIVVEGKEDASYLSSFIEAEYVITNGYDIPKEEIDYLNEASKHTDILVLVDPDEAGRQIEEKLKALLVKATYLCVDISKCSRGAKNGIAECHQEEIINILKNHFSPQKSIKNQVKLSKLEINDKNLRAYLATKFHLGICNAKKLLARINTLEISESEIRKAIKEHYGD